MNQLAAIEKAEILEKRVTLGEYLLREGRSKDKHEFYNGKIIKMPNAQFNHNLVASNATYYIRKALNNLDRKYLVIGDGQKIYIEAENIALYPDALVVFEKPQFHEGRKDMLTNPLLVVEVLSRSTAAYDRGSKFDFYQLIPSFQEYVLINPKKESVETRFREAPDLWRNTTYASPATESVLLRSLNIELLIQEIYENIEW